MLPFEALGGDGVDVALAQDDVVLAPDLDLVAVLGVEQHLVARLHGPHVRADADDLGPHSRLPIWAVAGMRMPPVDRRSPSLLRSFTRMRSFSILIGSLSLPPFRAHRAGDGTVSPGADSKPCLPRTRPTGSSLEADVAPADRRRAARRRCVAHPHPQLRRRPQQPRSSTAAASGPSPDARRRRAPLQLPRRRRAPRAPTTAATPSGSTSPPPSTRSRDAGRRRRARCCVGWLLVRRGLVALDVADAARRRLVRRRAAARARATADAASPAPRPPARSCCSCPSTTSSRRPPSPSSAHRGVAEHRPSTVRPRRRPLPRRGATGATPLVRGRRLRRLAGLSAAQAGGR